MTAPIVIALMVLLTAGPATAAPLAAGPGAAPTKSDDNDGTDPTKPASQIRLSYDRQELPGDFATDVLALEYNRPLGDGSWVIRPKVQLGRVDGPGVDEGLGFGDASLKLTKILERNRRFGIVGSLEVVAPTGNDRIGGGKWLAKPNIVFAIFMKGGHIFAPAVLHTTSFGGDAGLPPVNLTTLDFYFVPRLSNKKLFLTVDPALNFNWETSRDFAALAVTLGYKLGPMLGGRGQISVKPSIGIGRDAPFDYGMQLAFQLLGL